MNVPFLDLKAQYRSIKNEIDEAIADCVENTAFVQGKRVAAFEEGFAKYLGVGHCVGCANGTDAIYLALRALGVGPGDEVILPANTFIATSEAVSLTGAMPVMADVDPVTNNMGVAQAEACITPKTKALLPVHLYGMPADLEGLSRLAASKGLLLVADAAQAHGAKIGGKDIAKLAPVTCYSFFPGKNLGAFGDAGGVATDDAALAERIAMLRNHGRKDKYLHQFEGLNMRMDEIQGAVLRAKLPHLRNWTEGRRRVAAAYQQALAGLGDLVLPHVIPGREEVYHLFVVETAHRDALAAHLKTRGVATGVHYPVPLPLQPAYAHLGLDAGGIPVAVAKAGRILSLPMFPEMSSAQIEYVKDSILGFFEGEA